MKTAIHGRWNRHSSQIEEARNLWRIREAYDQKKVAAEELTIVQDKLTARFLSLLDEVGIDVVSDGGFRWDSAFDIARKLRGCEGFKTLHRIEETNHFHRASEVFNLSWAPELSTLPSWESEILKSDVEFAQAHTKKPILVSLVGPYTLARQSIQTNNVDFSKLVLAYSNVLHWEVISLVKRGVYVKIDDPQILLGSPDWSLIRRAYFELAYDIPRQQLFLCTWFHQIKNPEEYFALPFGGFFLDFTSDSEIKLNNLNTLKFFPKNKVLGAGVIDARHPAPLPDSEILFWMRSVLRRVSENRVWFCPNADLTFLPWDLAVEKVKQLVRLKKEVTK